MSDEIFTILPYGKEKRFLKLSCPKLAYLYFSDHRINLLSGERENYSVTHYLDMLDRKNLQMSKSEFEVHHLTYELSDLILLNSPRHLAGIPLAIEIVYTKKDDFNFSGKKANPIKLNQVRFPEKNLYKKKFTQGYKELLNGNSYQFNLTDRYEYEFEDVSLDKVINAFGSLGKKLGQFAHLTYISTLEKIIFSNSPECLFQLKKRGDELECVTNPIKGTTKRNSTVSIAEQWSQLKRDQKNQAELYMIIDLLRNDLSSIEKPRSKVIRKKALVLVPGLIHQMGIISVSLSAKVSIGKIIRSLFPGGSITGAPKQSTYNILKKIERSHRGHYTGSTLLIMQGRADCSINIRTAEIDLARRKLLYGAGGGVTLLSTFEEEYKEMGDKLESFISTFFKS